MLPSPHRPPARLFEPSTASGDLDKDGYDDLVVGQNSGPDTEAEGMTGGLIGVYYGGEDVPGTAEAGDQWGAQVRLADTDRDGSAELLAAAPGEDTEDGVAGELPAGTNGLVADGSWFYGAGSLGNSAGAVRFGAEPPSCPDRWLHAPSGAATDRTARGRRPRLTSAVARCPRSPPRACRRPPPGRHRRASHGA
ncbi:hypothetical protein [Streptomyces sp. NPDC058255]|uniref:hypothetical protein n=1 Tax=Streptomyces sp. NPDC058255 TaxID=3346407 RepID=UPI0036E6078D